MAKKFSLKDFKETIQVTKAEYKKDKFIELDDCLQEVLKLKGFPLGHITQCYGKSDTGKSSLMFHSIAKAQQQGILPVVIISEGKVDWNRARAMGVQYTGDLPEDQQQEDFIIVEENLKYLEDIFDFIDNKIINNVMTGKLPYNTMIFWDSMGNSISEKSVKIDKDGNREVKNTHMQAAAIKSERLTLLMDRVNDTRKINYPYSVGAFVINHVYTGQPAYAGAPAPEIVKGGNKVKFTASLMIKTQLVSKLEAIKDGSKLKFGMISKISITKNHINGQEYSGEFVITSDKFLPNDAKKIKDYKDENKDKWGNIDLYSVEDDE
jgi:RecA/RadA recombinase